MGRAYRLADPTAATSSSSRTRFHATCRSRAEDRPGTSRRRHLSGSPDALAELGAVLNRHPRRARRAQHQPDCGSQHTAGLRKAVVESGSPSARPSDGDGDRLIAVDETDTRSPVTDHDHLRSHGQGRGQAEEHLLVSTIMSNSPHCGLQEVRLRAATPPRWRPLLLEDMQRLGAVIRGEESGHR